MNTVLKTVSAAALLASSLAFAGAASAQDGADTFTFRVDRAALTDEGAIRVAYQRLNAEAQRYCEALPLNSIHTRASCRADVVDYVLTAVDHDGLKDLHVQRTQQARTLASSQN